jgi:DNA-directed RNA polymerase alpha subunit
MFNPDKDEFLKGNFKELNFSMRFQDMMVQNSFVTLGDILKVSLPRLLQVPGVSKHILTELLSFLEEHGLTRSLKHES